MQQIFSNTTLTVNQLIEKIDTGELGLPELQRPFIWKDSKVRDLFDSMMCGYPIGYLMLWECPTLEKKKTIGIGTHNYNENMHLTSLWFFYASLVSLYTGSFESTVENHLNSIKELTTFDELPPHTRDFSRE